MDTVQNKIDKLMLAKGKVMGKVAPQGAEEVIEEFITKYQETVEADTENNYSDLLAKSCKDVNEHLIALRLYQLVNTMYIKK